MVYELLLKWDNMVAIIIQHDEKRKGLLFCRKILIMF